MFVACAQSSNEVSNVPTSTDTVLTLTIVDAATDKPVSANIINHTPNGSEQIATTDQAEIHMPRDGSAHRLTVIAADYLPYDIHLFADKPTHTLTVPLKPATDDKPYIHISLTFVDDASSAPVASAVFVDGRLISDDVTEASFQLPIEHQSHTIVVRAPGYEERSMTFQASGQNNKHLSGPVRLKPRTKII